ncbi:MAG: hypothetical protein VR72_07630 [Clostridiaceae bacterium BRH_c20a]|nr:MAG: hypothetical protein VR72_07630 [Clostridiaceae bacterium BRH_c20a]
MNKKLFWWVYLILGFYLSTYLLKNLLLPFSVQILEDLEKSIISTNNGLLIIAAIKTIIYETLYDLPVFIFSYSFVYFYFRRTNLVPKFFYLLVITLCLYFITLNTYGSVFELITISLMLIGQIILIAIFHKNYDSFFSSLFVLIQLKLAFSCLLLAPWLNHYGVGYSDLVTNIKISASYLSRSSILNFISFAFFLPFTIGAVFFILLSILYTRRLESEKREKQKEKELLKMQMLAEEAQVWQELHFLIHDLKSPLMTTAGLNSLIELKVKDPQVKEYCQKIGDSVEAVNDMISEFLHNEKRKVINVGELINFVRANVIVKNANPQVSIKIPPNLPQININRIRMARALINVIENAIQAVSSESKPLIFIKINSDKDNKVFLTIIDNGSGISQVNLAKIWNVGFSTKDKSRGLGMSFVKKVIEDHGGLIKASSILGKGTVIQIVLPGVKAND